MSDKANIVYYQPHSNRTVTNSRISVRITSNERVELDYYQQVSRGYLIPMSASEAKLKIENNTIGWFVSNTHSSIFRPVRVSKTPEGNVVTIGTSTHFIDGTWNTIQNRPYYNKYSNTVYRGCTVLRTLEEATKVSEEINAKLKAQRVLVKSARAVLNGMVKSYSGDTYHY